MASPTETQSILSVRNLDVTARLRSGDQPVLSDVSFELATGEVLGVIGESGSGMTVLSRSIVNWLPAPLAVTGGEVLFRGKNLLTMSEQDSRLLRGREIAYIGSDPTTALDPTVPIGQHLTSKLMSVKPELSRTQARHHIFDLFDAVRIPSPKARFNEFPFQFSGGMMQRVMIVDALSADPALLIADNITQPLDVTVAKQIVRLLNGLRSDFDTSIMFVSSSLPMACDISQKLLVLQQGKILEQATPDNLINNPETDYSRRLISQVPRIWKVDHTPPASQSQKPILSVRDASITYHTKDPDKVFGTQAVQAVRGVSFDILEGENFGIVGESGCGKSTLTRLLSWIEPPDSGDILFDGQSISAMNAREIMDLRRQFQLILQDPYTCLPAHKTITQIIGEPMVIHRLASGKALRKRVNEVMTEVGLSVDTGNKLPFQLSASQRQRVNIARAMVMKPRLLILDETLSSLDQLEQARLLDLFDKLQAEHKFTYIFISHDLALVRRACSRIGVMYLGRMAEIAENEELFFEPRHPYSRAMLSAMPTLEENRYDAATYLLDGEPPSPVNIPPGCSFRTRCPNAVAACKTVDPEIHKSGTTLVECHLYSNAGQRAKRA
jgi:peptide/nickel transport system ATP-binding protein